MLGNNSKIILALLSGIAASSFSSSGFAAVGDQVDPHAGHDMSGHDMSMASRSKHGAGMWMLEYRYMRMNMDGLLDGTDSVAAANAVNSAGVPYEMLPTTMSMDMHMLMAMYGITNDLSAMAMGNYLNNVMSMEMHHGTTAMHNDMETSGIGDTQLAVSYAISNPLTVTLGVSIPTGSNDEQVVMMPGDPKIRAGYGMQLGSGTFDLMPSVTWNRTSSNFQWGGQGSYVYHLGSHNGYTLGDKVEASAWTKYQLNPGVWASARLALSFWDKIDGSDPKMDATMSPEMDANAQGGTRADALIGISGGKPMGLTLGLEFGIPVYQNLNGPQMKTTLIATGSLQWMY